MTRLLSDLLGAPQPGFGQRIKQLEQASGEPKADIRLSSDINQRTRVKIQELGLDPSDTTAPELYSALQQRLLGDETRLKSELGLDSSSATPIDVLSGVVQFASKLDIPRSCFALKTSVSKRLLKSVPPKKAMAGLNYRSVDSMIKHEPAAQIRAAAVLHESNHWQRAFFDQYDHLTPSDFETKDIALLLPNNSRWQKPAAALSAQHRHHSLVFKELGSCVSLPVNADVPALAITSLLLLLDGINTIRCASTFLKLQQVKADFGASVKSIVSSDPVTAADFAGQRLPWRIVQYYYHNAKEAYHPALFEPHVQPEDLKLVEAETILAQNLPALSFWEDTAGLAHVDGSKVVSLNMLDVALSVVNGLTFDQRLSRYVRQRVWGDIISRYLSHRSLDQNLVESLASQTEPVGLENGDMS
ncbi:MAG TPA: hypothetical protein VMR95_00855 [Candidatus Binatia bacterium]|nr:hypothetical protein [Candidatus Binatia bacterium]